MAIEKVTTQKTEVKSLLTPFLRKWLTVSLVLAALLIANTFYLLGNRLIATLPGEVGKTFSQGTFTITKFFQVMVLSHTGLGFLVVGLLLVFSICHLPVVWRRHRRKTVISGITFFITGTILAVTGPFIMHAAATQAHTWVWWLHVIAGGIVPIAYVFHRFASYVQPSRNVYIRFTVFMIGAVLILTVAHGVTGRDASLTAKARMNQTNETTNRPGSRGRELASFINSPYIPDGFVPPQSPFFPSPLTTATGDYIGLHIITGGDNPPRDALDRDLEKFGFVVNEKIGANTCERCHADIVEQWSKSAHRFASFNNPFYEATINAMRKDAIAMTDEVAEHIETYTQWEGRIGEIKSRWCGGCHDPGLMQTGEMVDDIDRTSLQAQAGLTCLACHAIDKIHNTTGNGNYSIVDDREDPYVFAGAANGTLRAFLHDTAIKSKPEVHKRQLLKPFYRTSEYCATCHKVSIPQAVNDFRWFRAQNEYDNWHDSGVALNASRTFYLPKVKQLCQDCHMPPESVVLGDVSAKNGMVRSHRFLAVNTALPFIRGDLETIDRIETFMQSEKLRIDIFAMSRNNESKQEKIYPLNHNQPVLHDSEQVTFDVVVRNLGVGHTFPGGTNDSNQGWIEFTLLDDQGQQIAQSGFVQSDGYVDPSAHFFRALIVDRNGKPIHMRNAQDIYSPIYMNVIGPGTAHVIHYQFTVPRSVSGILTLRARLLWRKFDRAYTEFAFETNRVGFKRFDECPNLPITEICRDEITLRVSDQTDQSNHDQPLVDEQLLAADWIRYNDYGIGLLLQSDTKGARQAFADVARLVKERIDGPRNLARVALRDGDLEAAYQWLLKCEEIKTNDPQTAWFWGRMLQEDGRYIEAVSAYRRVLQKFPEDRAVWRNLGRTYYLDGKYEQAIEAMNEVLKIDSEDRVAHYHIMLASKALGQDKQAMIAEIAYKRYKIDESAAEVTRAYRLKHPHDNLESQAIHVHELSIQE